MDVARPTHGGHLLGGHARYTGGAMADGMKPPPGGAAAHPADGQYFLLAKAAGPSKLNPRAETAGCLGIFLALAIVANWPGNRAASFAAVAVGLGSAVLSRRLQQKSVTAATHSAAAPVVYSV